MSESRTGGNLGSIGFTLAGRTFENLNILASFMRMDSRFHILATPQLMTLDNEEASVVVAENIPFISQTTTGIGANDSVLRSVDYRDVGITLNILPQVSSNGNINLKVHQIVSRIDEDYDPSVENPMPITRRREVNTRVSLEDGQTLVIAGLISRGTSDNTAKVPGLGDIPALGWLFKARKEREEDTNLLLFITPRVIKNREEAMALEVAKRQVMFRIETGSDGRVSAARQPMRTLPPRLEAAR